MFAVKKLLVAGLAVGSIALAGCGPQAKKAEQPDVLSQLKSDPSASLQTAATTVSKAKSMAVTMDGNVAGQKMTGRGAIQFGEPVKADMVMSVAGKEMTVRLIGTVQYVQLPAEQAQLLQGKRWMKFDLAQAAKMAGMNATQLSDQFRNMDPSTQVKAMLAGKHLKAVGEETVDGAKTVHYTATMTVDQYLDAYAKAGNREQLKKTLSNGKLDSIKTDLWVDEKYQVRKGAVVAGPLDLAYTYTDYGKPVTVVAPPAGETADLMELMKGMKTPA